MRECAQSLSFAHLFSWCIFVETVDNLFISPPRSIISFSWLSTAQVSMQDVQQLVSIQEALGLEPETATNMLWSLKKGYAQKAVDHCLRGGMKEIANEAVQELKAKVDKVRKVNDLDSGRRLRVHLRVAVLVLVVAVLVVKRRDRVGLILAERIISMSPLCGSSALMFQ